MTGPPTDTRLQLERTLAQFMGSVNARAVVGLALQKVGLDRRRLDEVGLTERLANELVMCSRLYVRDPQRAAQLAHALRTGESTDTESAQPVEVEVSEESDIVKARGLAKEMARRLGFDHLDQIKISTAVSELARNISRYAGRGRIYIRPRPGPAAKLEVIAEDKGPGIVNLDAVLSGAYVSKTGMGRGLYGCKVMMDEFDVVSTPRGTRVRMAKVVSS